MDRAGTELSSRRGVAGCLAELVITYRRGADCMAPRSFRDARVIPRRGHQLAETALSR